MDSIIKKLRIIYKNSCSVALAAAAVCVFVALSGLKIPAVIILTAGILSKALIRVFLGRKNSIFPLLLTLTALAFALVVFRVVHFDFFEKLFSLFDWAHRFFFLNGEYKAVYAYILTILVVLAASIVAHIIEKYYISRLISGALIFILALVLSIGGRDIPKFSVCLFLFYLLNVFIENINLLFNKKISRANSKISAVYLMPVLTLAAMLVIFFPSGSKPIQWTWVKALAHAVYQCGENIFHDIKLGLINSGGEFSYGTLGYSEKDKKLGGSVASGDGIMLYVQMLSRPKGGVYLTGSVKNEFTGDSWTNTLPKSKLEYDEYTLDTYELIAFLSAAGVSKSEMKEYCLKKNMTVEYQDLITKSLFYTLKTFDIDKGSSAGKFNSLAPSIIFKKTQSEGTSYIINYLDVNYSSNDFSKLCIMADNTDYDSSDYFNNDFIAMTNKLLGYSLNSAEVRQINEAYRKRVDIISEYYTCLPESLPKRVYTLADEITSGCESDYEKLKAIESYLSRNYTYSTSPGEIPEESEFVDYFLFEKKEGYCTYYSTAMAVLGRCVGIPTRFVEGALLDFSIFVPNKGYAVQNNSAHAWVEAYIEGVGWIPFEPTQTYSQNRYTEWGDSQYSGGLNHYYPEEQPSAENDISDESSLEASHAEKEKRITVFSIVIILIAAILLFVTAMALGYFIARLRYKNRIKNSGAKARTMIIFNEIIYLLRLNGFCLLTNDTILSFSEKIGKKFSTENVCFKDISEIFMKIRYADKEISKAEVEKVAEYRTQLEAELSEKISKIKMLFIRLSIYMK
ncbi:MAG: transglutaminase-like domain-containing protein [Oscillospiraceae bacterium]|jgi:hypothetical protein